MRSLRVAQHALGSVELLSVNTLEELALAMIRTGASHFVVCSRQPGGGVQTALTQGGKRFVAVLDKPRIALRELPPARLRPRRGDARGRVQLRGDVGYSLFPERSS